MINGTARREFSKLDEMEGEVEGVDALGDDVVLALVAPGVQVGERDGQVVLVLLRVVGRVLLLVAAAVGRKAGEAHPVLLDDPAVVAALLQQLQRQIDGQWRRRESIQVWTVEHWLDVSSFVFLIKQIVRSNTHLV